MLRRGQDRREERREGPAASGKNHYQMRENLISIGDDFWIENQAGQKAFKVDGKAVRVRNTLVLEDASGRELYKIQERMLRIKDSMEIEGPNGQQVAMVKKALITPVRERWTVNIHDRGHCPLSLGSPDGELLVCPGADVRRSGSAGVDDVRSR